MSGELIFEEPPMAERGRAATGKWGRILGPLRENPGQWARLPGDYAATMASEIKRGRPAGIEPGEFDATCRKIKRSSRYHVWVRYVGGKS